MSIIHRLQKLPEGQKKILAIVLSVLIIFISVLAFSFINNFLKQNIVSIREFFSFN